MTVAGYFGGMGAQGVNVFTGMPHRPLTCPDDSTIFPYFAYFKLSYAISDPKIVSISPNMKIQMLSTIHPLALRPSGHGHHDRPSPQKVLRIGLLARALPATHGDICFIIKFPS